MTAAPVRCRIKSIKGLPPVARGHKRAYKQCQIDGTIGFYDYVPYSLSDPVMVMPCGHGVRTDAKTIGEQEALAGLLAALAVKSQDGSK